MRFAIYKSVPGEKRKKIGQTQYLVFAEMIAKECNEKGVVCIEIVDSYKSGVSGKNNRCYTFIDGVRKGFYDNIP